MTPEEEQAVQRHAQAIAAILYRNSDTESLKVWKILNSMCVDISSKASVPPSVFFYLIKDRNPSRTSTSAPQHPRQTADDPQTSPSIAGQTIGTNEQLSGEMLPSSECQPIVSTGRISHHRVDRHQSLPQFSAQNRASS